MRVEGHVMMADYNPAKTEVQGIPSEKGHYRDGREKIGLEDLNLPAVSKAEPEELKEAVETVNKAIKISNYHLEFQVHEESGRFHIKVVDSDSDEVIREIPPEYMLELSAKVKKMLDDVMGILVDKFV